MTKDELIRMAEEAGFVVDEKARQYQPNCIFHTYHMVDELLARFAALVSTHEREACARVCDDWADALDRHKWPTPYECAEAIRARGNT